MLGASLNGPSFGPPYAVHGTSADVAGALGLSCVSCTVVMRLSPTFGHNCSPSGRRGQGRKCGFPVRPSPNATAFEAATRRAAERFSSLIVGATDDWSRPRASLLVSVVGGGRHIEYIGMAGALRLGPSPEECRAPTESGCTSRLQAGSCQFQEGILSIRLRACPFNGVQG